MSAIDTAYYESPTGVIKIAGSENGISSLIFVDRAAHTDIPESLREAVQQIHEYFSGTRREFSMVLDLQGTPFQKRVWEALLAIPFGHTTSYGVLATELGDIKAIRAVGRANGSNPVSIVVPCHRVIGADGSLTGYAGGLHRKQWLLQFEKAIPQTDLFSMPL